MTTNTLLVVILLLLAVTSSTVAIVLALVIRPRHFTWPAVLAITTILLSIMGVTGWTPFGFFPEVGWTNGAISVRSGPFFFVPLLIGTMALVAIMSRSRSRDNAPRL